jgi:hypothetical protein
MTAFTRQHFKAVGKVLAKSHASEEQVSNYAKMFKEDNPRFDEERFRTFVKDESLGRQEASKQWIHREHKWDIKPKRRLF